MTRHEVPPELSTSRTKREVSLGEHFGQSFESRNRVRRWDVRRFICALLLRWFNSAHEFSNHRGERGLLIFPFLTVPFCRSRSLSYHLVL